MKIWEKYYNPKPKYKLDNGKYSNSSCKVDIGIISSQRAAMVRMKWISVFKGLTTEPGVLQNVSVILKFCL